MSTADQRRNLRIAEQAISYAIASLRNAQDKLKLALERLSAAKADDDTQRKLAAIAKALTVVLIDMDSETEADELSAAMGLDK